MPTIVTCSTCGAKLQLKKLPASGRFKCPKCGSVSSTQPAPPDDKLIGRTIGGHKIQSALARGAVTTVYKATQISMRRSVAVKVLPPEHAEPERVEDFFARAKDAARLTHPGIVSVYDMGTENNASYYSMEYVEGATIEQLLQDKGLPPVEDAVKICIEAGRALAYAIQSGVQGYDLSPRTVMLSNKGEVKLLSSLVQGRLGAQAQPVADLGRLFYHLLTGRQAKAGERPAPANQVNASVTPAVQRVVDRMLAPGGSDGYAGLDEAIDAIDRSIHLRVPVRAERRAGAGERGRPRHHGPSKAAPAVALTVSIVSVIVLIAVAAAGYYYWVKSRRTGPEERIMYEDIRKLLEAGQWQNALDKSRQFKDMYASSGYIGEINKIIPQIEKKLQRERRLDPVKQRISAVIDRAMEDPTKKDQYLKELDEIRRQYGTIPGVDRLVQSSRNAIQGEWETLWMLAGERVQKAMEDRHFKIALAECERLAQLCKGNPDVLEKIERETANVKRQAELEFAQVVTEADKLVAQGDYAQAIKKYQFVIDHYGIEDCVREARAKIAQIRK